MNTLLLKVRPSGAVKGDQFESLRAAGFEGLNPSLIYLCPNADDGSLSSCVSSQQQRLPSSSPLLPLLPLFVTTPVLLLPSATDSRLSLLEREEVSCEWSGNPCRFRTVSGRNNSLTFSFHQGSAGSFDRRLARETFTQQEIVVPIDSVPRFVRLLQL